MKNYNNIHSLRRAHGSCGRRTPSNDAHSQCIAIYFNMAFEKLPNSEAGIYLFFHLDRTKLNKTQLSNFSCDLRLQCVLRNDLCTVIDDHIFQFQSH